MSGLSSEKTVVPHVGVRVERDEVRFGMDREAVRTILGEPAETDSESVPDWESWSYPDLGLEVTFDADEEYRCTYMQVNHGDYAVGGRKLIGLDRAAILREVSGLGLGEEDSDDGEETMEFPDVALEIHFESDRSVMLGWSAEIDETDEFRFPRAQQ